jgi:homocysteine S-methyltransferase
LGIPAWLSYTISGNRTRAGQPLEDAFAVAADNDDIVAVGVNCCSPADVPLAIATAREVTGKPVIVYPNSGEHWDAEQHSWTGPALFSPEQARQWLAAGASIIGGCCRVRPADIASLSRTLQATGDGAAPLPSAPPAPDRTAR